MDMFNIIAGSASIIGLLVALFIVNKYIKKTRKTNISQTAVGTNNKQSIKYNDK